MEPPGTAPGSDPLITSAFMSIVPKDKGNIGPAPIHCKGVRGGEVGLFRHQFGAACQPYGGADLTRQAEGEGAALARFAGHAEAAAMRLRDIA